MIDHPSWHPQPWHEIVNEDCYRLKRLRVVPATVYDIGMNLGCFVARAKGLWPACRVIGIEPHPSNVQRAAGIVRGMPGVTWLHCGLGSGVLRWIEAIGGEANPGGHSYVSNSVGYPDEHIASMPTAECPAMMLDELVEKYPPNGPYVVKIDCEGAEECLFDHGPSNAVLKGAAYFTAELHFFAAQHREIPESDRLAPELMGTHGHVIRACLDWVYGFTGTHHVELELAPNSGMLWATRKDML